MNVSLSAVLLFGLASLAALRYGSLRFGAGLLALLFGFYLARTDAAGTVDQLMGAVVDALSSIGN